MIIIQQKTKQAKQTNKQKKTYLPIMAHLSNQIW